MALYGGLWIETLEQVGKFGRTHTVIFFLKFTQDKTETDYNHEDLANL